MDTESSAVNFANTVGTGPAPVSKLHSLVPATATSDLNNAIEGQPTYQTNYAKSNATSSPILRTRSPVPFDRDNLLDDDGPASTVTTSSTHARKPSVTDTLIEGAASVVAAARRLVLHDDEDAIEDEEGEGSQAAHTGTDASSSRILPSFLVPDTADHHGLEFSQRRLSIERNRKPLTQGSGSGRAAGALGGSEAGTISSEGPDSKVVSGSASGPGAGSTLGSGVVLTSGAGPASGVVSASGVGSATGVGSAPGAGSGTGAGLLSDVGSASSVGLASSVASQSGGGSGVESGLVSGSAPKNDTDGGSNAGSGHQKDASQSEPIAAHVSSSGADRITMASSDMGQNPNSGPSGGAFGGEGLLSGALHDSVASVSSSHWPKQTMYVTGRDPSSMRQQGMNVDKPSVSRTSASSGSHSSMGVDVPRMVGDTHNSHNGRRDSRSSGLNVDRKSALADHPHDGDEIHIQDKSEPPKKTTNDTPISTGKYGEENVGHYRTPAASGLNVDSRNTKSSAVARTSEDHGIQETKSAINVDKASSVDHKKSGMNVDSLATSSLHLAEAGHHDRNAFFKDTVNASGKRRDSNRGSLYDKVKNVFRRHGDDNSTGVSGEVTSAGISSAGNASNVMETGRRQDAHSHSYSAGGVSDSSIQGSSSVISSEGGRLVLNIPEGYDGPIPQVAPGEDVVWVKRIIQTDYYDDEGEKQHTGSRQSSVGSFLGRIRGEGHHQDVDKGKSRA